jgi:PEGA domain
MSFMRAVALVVFVLAPALLASATASAQGRRPPAPPPSPAAPPPPSPPSPSPSSAVGPAPLAATLTGEAKASYESGKLLYADGDYEGARVKFDAAYQKAKDPRLLWNVAACEKNLRHYARALELLRTYVAEGGALLTEQDRAEAADVIRVMEPLTAKLIVKVSEPGAEVTVDDDAVGTSPVRPVVVDIGTRHVRVKKAEFEDAAKDVNVGGGNDVEVAVTLVRIVHEGRMVVNAQPGDVIAVDGTTVGTGTWSGVLRSGAHGLRVSAPKKVTYEAEIVVQDKQIREVPVTLQPVPSSGVPVWVWIAGSAVVVTGATVGGYFLFRSKDTYDGPTGSIAPGLVNASHPIRF